MRRALRWILVGAALLAVMIVSAGLTVLYGASPHHIQQHAIDDFTQATGLSVETGGEIRPVLTPVPGWHLGAITITDPQATDGTRPLLTATDALLTIAPEGLLQRTLNIAALRLNNVQIALPKPTGDALAVSLPTTSPKVSFLRLRNAEISIGQPGSDTHQTITLSDAAVDYAGAKRPVRLTANGTWRNRKINAHAKITSPDRIVRKDWVFAEIDAKIDGDTVTYSGRFKPLFDAEFPVVAGNATAQIANPAGAISWLTQTPPNNTLINLGDLSLESRIETLPQRLLLRTRWAGEYFGTRLSLDTTLRGDADWRDTGAGSLNAVARAGGLFSSYLNGSFAREQGISGDLSFSALDLPGMFDAKVFPQEYRLTSAKNGSVKGRLSATTQGLALSDTKLILGKDRYTGDAAIDLRGPRPIISLGTTLEDLRIDPWVDPVLDGQRPLTRVLPNLDADLVLEVNAQTVRYGDLSAGPMTASVSTRPDAMVLDLRRLDMAQGVLAGSLSTAPTSSLAKLDLTGAEINAADLARQFGLSGIDGILGGSVQAELPFPPDDSGWRNVSATGTASLYQVQLDGVDFRASQAGPNARSAMAQVDLNFTLDGSELEATRLSMRDSTGGWTGRGKTDLLTRMLAAEVFPDDQPDAIRTLAGTLDAPTMAVAAPTETPESSNTPASPATDSEPATPEETPEVATVADQVEPEPTESAQQASLTDEESEASAAPSVAGETSEPAIAAAVPPTQEDEPAPAATSQAEVPAEEPNPEATGPENSPIPLRPRR